ncbi:MAG: hypothetical protein ACKVS8_12380 [Phycisphaerales bacterium]
MRLPHTKIWRAFPELDQFDDVQCARFVRASRRGLARFGRVAATLGVAAIGWITVLCVGVVLSAPRGRARALDQFLSRVPLAALWIALAIVGALLLATLPALWLRARLLRLRIATLLRDCGTCLNCRYLLLGLPVSSDLTITCPECGRATRVDPALGELARRPDGTAYFQPGPDSVREPPPLLTRRRLLGFAKCAGAVIATIALIAGARLGWIEVGLHIDAARARAARAGPGSLAAVIEKMNMQGQEGGGPNGWTLFQATVAQRETIDRAQEHDGALSSPGTFPDFDAVSPRRPPDPNRSEIEVAENAANSAAARTLLVIYKRDGLFEKIDALRDSHWGVRPLNLDPGDSLVGGIELPEVGQGRGLARITHARARLAALEGDPNEFLAAFDSMVAISRLLVRQPFDMDMLSGQAIIDRALDAAMFAIETHPNEPWLSAIERRVASLPRDLDPQALLVAEQAEARESLCWYFQDPSRPRGGLDTVHTLWPDAKVPPAVIVGRFGSALADLEARFALDAAALAAGQPKPPPPRRARALTHVLGQWGSAWYTGSLNDTQAALTRGVTTIIALERFRHAHAHYPTSLQDLVPAYIATVPIDPFDGTPLKYRHVAAPLGQGQESFVLYSVDRDGRDDGGAWYPSGGPGGSPADLVLRGPK